MRNILTVIISFLMIQGFSQGSAIQTFSITPVQDVISQPLSLDLSGIDYNEDSLKLVVFHSDGNKKTRLRTQLEPGVSPRLWFDPGKTLKAGHSYDFEIHREEAGPEKSSLLTTTDRDNITVMAGSKQVFKYRHSMIEAPEGTNPLYRREGGYIHPLYSPAGKLLTNIQPDDHYHHYGIWNPWTRTIFEGRSVDFWNLADGQGTVRLAGILSTWSGKLTGGFKVHHEHVDFSAPGADKTAMNETWDVRVSETVINENPVWIIDFSFTLNCATDSAVELSAYRYGGGIGFRATEQWTRENSSVLTSEGRTRKDADASFARWCLLEGDTGQGERSGVVFFSHPANRAHPEPMRVWPEDQNDGRGDLFFEFCPIRHKAWVLEPGKEYVLRYRMLVFDGELKEEIIDQLWSNYAYPPRADIK